MYLRCGGAYYNAVDKSSIHGQLRILTLLEMIFSLAVGFLALTMENTDKSIIIGLFGLCILVYIPRSFLHNLLQATNRVDKHATGLIIDKVVHLFGIFLGIFAGQMHSTWFVVSDLIGRVFGGCYIFFVCRDVLSAPLCKIHKVRIEASENIRCGFILMISNVASMLIIGIVRQGIELFWDVETFGKLSLTLSVSNMLMTFINSIAMVLFPVLRRASTEDLNPLYRKMRIILVSTIMGAMVFSYPIKRILCAWLPQYEEGLKYTAILFVMCIYESKMSMLINTFLKTLRQERLLLRYNSISVLASLLLTIITCGILRNLDLAVVSIVVLLAFRSTIAEIALSQKMGLQVKKDVLAEHLVASLFIVANWIIGGVSGMLIYASVYALFLFVNRNSLRDLVSGKIKH